MAEGALLPEMATTLNPRAMLVGERGTLLPHRPFHKRPTQPSHRPSWGRRGSLLLLSAGTWGQDPHSVTCCLQGTEGLP